MAESRKNKSRKSNLEKFKQKQKTMANQTQQTPASDIRNTPVWQAGDSIEMNGLEFQEIFNYINGASQAFQAVHSVLNKNIMNGTVKMQFEKQNPQTGQFEPLQGEDAKPYETEFNQMVEKVKAEQAERQNPISLPTTTESFQEDQPEVLDSLVNANGVPIREEDRAKPNLSIV